MRYKERTHECNRNVCKETNKIEDQYITHNSELTQEKETYQQRTYTDIDEKNNTHYKE
jgi:hypothetical protein